ncbi:MAG: ATP-binding protein [Chloroflexota bacterium]|nr:ATP-binding protein [Chloroflexota bacterium]
MTVPTRSSYAKASAPPKIEDKLTKVLLVCKDHRDAQLIHKSMAEVGFGAFAVEFTDQVSIGLQRLAKGGIDVLLFKLAMTDSQGLDALSKLHAQAPGVPIVVITSGSAEPRDLALPGDGIQEYVAGETIDGRLLVRSICRAMERKRIASQMEQKIRSLESNVASLHNFIARSGSDAVVIVDQKGIVRFANPATESVLSCKTEQLLGERLSFIPNHEGETKQFAITTANGESRAVEMQVAKTEYNGEPAYLASLRDITRRKANEEARPAGEDAQAAKKALEDALSRANEETRLAREDAQTTKKTLEDALSKATEEARLAREDAQATKKTLENALSRANEEARLAREDAQATKKTLENALIKANEGARLAREDAQATKKTLEDALGKANEEARLAREDAQATKQASEDALSKARDETRRDSEDAATTKKTLEDALTKASEDIRVNKEKTAVTWKTLENALLKANEETRMAREDAQATKQALEDDLSQARDKSQRASEDTASTKQTLEAALNKAQEEARLAREDAETTKQVFEDALSQAREETRLARGDAQATKQTLEDALGKAREETRRASEDAAATKQTLEAAVGKANEETRLTREDAQAMRKTLEDALSKANEETRLARQHAETTKQTLKDALSKAREETRLAREALRKVDRMQSQQMSNTLHELRTPLHAIIGFTGLVLGGKVADPDTQKEFLTIIMKQSEHLRDLVDELVDVSIIESDRFEIRKERVSIKGLIQGAVRELSVMTGQKNIAISEDIPVTLPEIEVDGKRLRQVMFNLLDNAIKFSNHGGHINVKAGVQNGKLLIQVSDQGVGIAEEDITAIFERFYRAPDSTRTGGLGLGLYISKQIVEAHGGHIWAESIEGKGSTLSFTLPLSQVGESVHE